MKGKGDDCQKSEAIKKAEENWALIAIACATLRTPRGQQVQVQYKGTSQLRNRSRAV